MKNELLIWFGWSIGSSIWFLQCCSSFRGSSSIWGARAPRVVKMASQLGILSSLAYQADSSSPFIHQTWIFCKENGSKRSFLPEIEVQTFWYTLYAVTTACCVPWQIPKEIWKNTAGKSATMPPISIVLWIPTDGSFKRLWHFCLAFKTGVCDKREMAFFLLYWSAPH